MNKYIRIALLTYLILFLYIVGLIGLGWWHTNRNIDLQRQVAQHQRELVYYQNTFGERIGYRIGNYGRRLVVRAVTIDGGKSWLEVTQGREVLGYLHQRHPGLDPDDFQELESNITEQ